MYRFVTCFKFPICVMPAAKFMSFSFLTPGERWALSSPESRFPEGGRHRGIEWFLR
jgi:hypothetical protein